MPLDLSAFDDNSSSSPITEDLLDRMRQVESGGNPNAIGPMTYAGTAKGPYQFTDATALDMGLDNPFDEKKSRAAARKLMEKHYASFGGDLDKALSAYNWGAGNVNKVVAKYGDDWSNHIPDQTKNYLSKILGNDSVTTKVKNVQQPIDLSAFDQSDNKLDLSAFDSDKPQTNNGWFRTDPNNKTSMSPFSNTGVNELTGAVHGLVTGVVPLARGVATAFGQNPLQFMSPAQASEYDEGIVKTIESHLPDSLQKRINSPEAQRTEAILGIPFTPLTKSAEWLKEQGHPELAAALLQAGAVASLGLGHKAGKTSTINRPKEIPEAVKPLDASTTGLEETTLSKEEVLANAQANPETHWHRPMVDENGQFLGVPEATDEAGFLTRQSELPTDMPGPHSTLQDRATELARNSPSTDLFDPENIKKENPLAPVQRDLDFNSPTDFIAKQKEQNLKGQTPDLFTEENYKNQEIANANWLADAPARAAEAKPGFLRTAEDLIELKKRPISNRGPLNRQRGAFSIDDLSAERAPAKDLTLPLSYLRTLKGLFGETETPNPKSLSYLRDAMKDGSLPNPDDRPILVMNGKGEAAIYDGNHRIKVADELGWKQMPVKVIQYGESTGQKIAPPGKTIGGRGISPEAQRALAKKQGGALNVSALWGKDKATQSDLALSKEAVDDTVVKYLENSASLDEFTRKLKLFSDNPDFVRNIVGSAPQLWGNRGRLISGYRGSVYSKLDKMAQKQTADVGRSAERMMNEEGITAKKIKKEGDIHTEFQYFADAHGLQQLTFNKQAGRVIKWVIDNTREILNSGVKIYKDMSAHMEDYNALPRADKFKVIDTAIKFDGTQSTVLRDAGLQWPSEAMLRKEGLNDSHIKAYQGITKAVDKAYEIMDAAMAKTGAKMPPRIPGYFPHFWMGSYRAMIRKGGENGPLVKMKAFSTKWARNRFIAEQERANPDLHFTPEDPKADVYDKEYASLMVQALELEGNLKGIDKAMQTRLIKMDAYAKRGIIKDVLERDWIKGHLAEEGLKADTLFNRVHNDRLISAYHQHIQAASNFWANTHIVADVYGPYTVHMAKILKEGEAKNALRYVQDFIGNATGHKTNHLAALDQYLRQEAIDWGLPPEAFLSAVRGGGQLLSITKLVMPNTGFWIANIFQPVPQVGQLAMVHAERLANGLKGGDPLKASTELFREMGNLNQGKGSPVLEEALNWAVKNNRIEVYEANHLSPWKQDEAAYQVAQQVSRNPLEYIEKRGRASSFLASYMYFKDVMPKREALEAASNRMNMMMGNYQRVNTARMYSDFGIAGQAMRPFAILRNVYNSVAIDSIKSTYLLAKEKGISDPAVGKSAMGLVALQLGYLLTAGVSGMIGVQEWDHIVDSLRELFGGTAESELPVIGKRLLRSDEALREWGANDTAIYGSIAQVLGILGKPFGLGAPNIGPSLAAPAFTEAGGIPALSVGKAVGGLAIEAGKAALQPMGLTDGANWENIYKYGRELAPTMAVPWIEGAIADKQAGVTPGTTKFNGAVTRTPQQDLTAKVYGKRDITEEDQRLITRSYNRDRELNSEWKATQVSKIVDSYLGIGFGDTQDLIKNAIETNHGFDAVSLHEAIKAEVKKRITDEETRRMQQIKGEKNVAQKAYDINKLMRLDRRLQ